MISERPLAAVTITFVALATFNACAGDISPRSTNGYQVSSATASRPLEKPGTQYLYTYNAGSGQYGPAFGRYSLPDLKLRETVSTILTSSTNVAFGKQGEPFFADQSAGRQNQGYAVWQIPLKSGTAAPVEQFSGLCGWGNLIGGYPLGTDPAGNFYVSQTCTSDVQAWKPGRTDKPKKPFATYTGGNLGESKSSPTAVAVDHEGGLYVGDNAGGVTYFAAGSMTPVVAFPTGCCGAIYELTVDGNDKVWSTRAGGQFSHFANDKSCVVASSGSVERSEVADEFSKGGLMQRFYSLVATDSRYDGDAESIAVDSDARVYLAFRASVLEFRPGDACPDPNFKLFYPKTVGTEVAVDQSLNYYVTDELANTITEYPSASTKPRKKVVQGNGLVSITNLIVGPP